MEKRGIAYLCRQLNADSTVEESVNQCFPVRCPQTVVRSSARKHGLGICKFGTSRNFSNIPRGKPEIYVRQLSALCTSTCLFVWFRSVRVQDYVQFYGATVHFTLFQNRPNLLRQKDSPRSTFIVGKRVLKLGLLRIRRHYFRGSSVGKKRQF